MAKIKYNNNDLVELKSGQMATLKCKDKKMIGDIVVSADESDCKPIEISSLDEALLVADNEGKIYKYDEKLYQVEKIKSLKGLTIRFNEHIEPCPLITDDSEFECSGVIWSDCYSIDTDPYFIHNISKLTKSLPDSYISGDRLIAFIIRDYAGFHYVLADNQEEAGWYIFDENGNEWLALYESDGYKGFNITNFNCPELNENPEFIKWVLNNAKVYSKIESAKDVKAFKNSDLGARVFNCYQNSIGDAKGHTIENYYSPIEVQFTASFIKNGELVIKNFNTLHLNEGIVNFYTNEGDLLSFETDYNIDTIPTIVKYNGEVLDNNPIFTEFDSVITETYSFTSYLMQYCELVDMEVNECYFVEYVDVKGSGGASLNIHYGLEAPEDTSKLWVKLANEPSKVEISNSVSGGNETLDYGISALPTACNSLGCASVGTKIYLFGGAVSDSRLNTINVFNTETNTIETLYNPYYYKQ